MRIALAAVGSIGLRAGRVLLADSRVTELGSLGREVRSNDRRVRAVDSAEGFDLLVSNALLDDPRVVEAVGHRVPLVTPHPLAQAAALPGDAPSVAACSPHTGLPAALASIAAGRLDRVDALTATVTAEPGRVRRRRVAAFPAPIGSLWCEPIPTPVAYPKDLTFCRAPYDGPLLGISVRAEGTKSGRPHADVTGIVDDPDYLAAIALAAAALMLIDAGTPEGRFEVQRRAAEYLDACTRAGVGIAEFTPAL